MGKVVIWFCTKLLRNYGQCSSRMLLGNVLKTDEKYEQQRFGKTSQMIMFYCTVASIIVGRSKYPELQVS